MSKKAEKRLQQEYDHRLSKRLVQLGWEEVDDWDDACFRWRCANCKQPKMFVDCGICQRCEQCYSCQPDTKAGNKALENYKTKGSVTINFDAFGNDLP